MHFSMTRVCVILSIFFLTVPGVAGQEIFIITNQDSEISSIRSKDLKALFLMQTHQIQGKEFKIVEYRMDNLLRLDFARTYLNLDEKSLNQYWRKRFLKVGQQDPVSKINSKVVFVYLKRNLNVLGYCSSKDKLPQYLKRVQVEHY